MFLYVIVLGLPHPSLQQGGSHRVLAQRSLRTKHQLGSHTQNVFVTDFSNLAPTYFDVLLHYILFDPKQRRSPVLVPVDVECSLKRSHYRFSHSCTKHFIFLMVKADFLRTRNQLGLHICSIFGTIVCHAM